MSECDAGRFFDELSDEGWLPLGRLRAVRPEWFS